LKLNGVERGNFSEMKKINGRPNEILEQIAIGQRSEVAKGGGRNVEINFLTT
jgi:hypothetical protein